MTYYAALDVGLRTTAVCIVDGNGEIQLERSLTSEVDDIVTCLRGFGAQIAAVGLEAGTLTQWLTYGLRAADFRPVVMEARHVKAALGAMRNKTDRNDAHGIAQILRTGWHREVYVKSLESHYVRTLLASRKALLRKCIDLENEVRGLLKVFGIKLRAGIRHGAFDAATREPIEANAMLAHAPTSRLRRITPKREQQVLEIFSFSLLLRVCLPPRPLLIPPHLPAPSTA